MNSDRLRTSALLLLLLATGACGRPDVQVEYCPGVYRQKVADTMVVRAGPATGRMGKHLQVRLRMPTTAPDLKNLRLFIDGHPIPELPARQIGARCVLRDSARAVMGLQEVYEFVPVRTDSSREMWAHLLGSPGSFTRTVRVGAGLANGPEFKSLPDSANVAFTVADRTWFWLLAAVLLGLLWLFFQAARSTSILKDPAPPLPAEAAAARAPADAGVPAPRERPFSLAKVVMAMWTFLILAGFFGIWLITGDHRGILTDQALLLLGLVGTSAAVSTTMTRTKNEEVTEQAAEAVDEEMEQPEAAADAAMAPAARAAARSTRATAATRAVMTARAPATRGILTDLLSDENGPALHRFQNLLWNVALAFVFMLGVYRTLALPEFDSNLLLLLGISQGLYLGLKLPEPRKPGPAEAPPREGGNARSRRMGARTPRVDGN